MIAQCFHAVEHACRFFFIAAGDSWWWPRLYSLDLLSNLFLVSKPTTNKPQKCVVEFTDPKRGLEWGSWFVFCKHACMHYNPQRGYGLINKTCTVHAMTCAKIRFQPRRCISSFRKTGIKGNVIKNCMPAAQKPYCPLKRSPHVSLNMDKERQPNTFFSFRFELPAMGSAMAVISSSRLAHA